MKSQTSTTRRDFVRLGGVLAIAIPIIAVSTNASAATNAGMRTALKYQDQPNDGKDCATCLQFVPGKSATAPGGCKVIPGDTEISPKGYCTAWTAKPK